MKKCFERGSGPFRNADKLLDRSSVFCELHFEERFIARHYTHILNGQEMKTERDRPRLTDDAVPSFFPNTPAYLSRKLPQKKTVKDFYRRGTWKEKRKERWRSSFA